MIRIAALVSDRYEAVSGALGVDFRTGRLLVAVHRRPHTVGELGRYVRVTKSTMTGIIARMVADGLVSREADPSDGRAIVIVPTVRGREVADAVIAGVRAEVWALTEDLTETEQSTLATLLESVLTAADRADAILPEE